MGTVHRQETVLVGCKIGAWHELEKRVFSHCFNTWNAQSEFRKKCKNVANMGALPGQFLGNYGSDRDETNTGV